ncbi:hypothetical protein KKF11_00320, partial [Patescibacteria group bacterium]|nr:hypothetical protein [Patescibacteria group bacterium]
TDMKEFRSNVSLGAKEEFIDIEKAPAEMKEIVIKATKVLNLEIAGADVLIDSTTGKQWILEVNRGPGLTYDTSISPELKQLSLFFQKKINHE